MVNARPKDAIRLATSSGKQAPRAQAVAMVAELLKNILC